MIYYIWYLMAAFHLHPVCILWTGYINDVSINKACGAISGKYQIRVEAAKDNRLLCDYYGIIPPEMHCKLTPPMDQYIISLYNPEPNEVLCIIDITHLGEPSPKEVDTACQDRADIVQEHTIRGLVFAWMNNEESSTSYLLQAPPAVTYENLDTAINYQILGKYLNWYYGNRYDIAEWQNQFNGEIETQGINYHVPPHILKSIIAQESQFWPLWTGDKEAGLIQLTQDGAVIALTYSPDLYNQFCPLLIYPGDCPKGFYLLSLEQQNKLSTGFLGSLQLSGSLDGALKDARKDIKIYSQILRAFWSYSAELGYPDWSYALAIYHAGQGCIKAGIICPAGREYEEAINQ